MFNNKKKKYYPAFIGFCDFSSMDIILASELSPLEGLAERDIGNWFDMMEGSSHE